MLNVNFRKLREWPERETPHDDRGNPFSASYGQTFDLLEKELGNLRANQVVIEADSISFNIFDPFQESCF